MKSSILSTLAVFAVLCVLPTRAHAAFTFTLAQTNGNVVVTGAGSLNIIGLTNAGNGSAGAGIAPSIGSLYGGPENAVSFTVYSGVSGPASFGSGLRTTPITGSGSLVGIQGNGYLAVPAGYVSGTVLNDTSTYFFTSFAGLGFNPGTYTYTWGSGANADSLTIIGVVPEPSTWAMLGLGTLGTGAVAMHRRQRVV